MNPPYPLTFLLHEDDPRYFTITRRLRDATFYDAKNFSVVIKPATIDDVFYHDDTLQSTVFTREEGTRYFRLRLRPERHQVFRDLLDLMLAPYGVEWNGAR